MVADPLFWAACSTRARRIQDHEDKIGTSSTDLTPPIFCVVLCNYGMFSAHLQLLLLSVPFLLCVSARVSPDGTCGGVRQFSCPGSVWGDCCSQQGLCGSSPSHCQAHQGCQQNYGNCEQPKPPKLQVSDNGCCGEGVTCKNSGYGECCSFDGFWYVLR